MSAFDLAMRLVVVTDTTQGINTDKTVQSWLEAYRNQRNPIIDAELIFIGVPRETRTTDNQQEVLLTLLRDNNPCTDHCVLAHVLIGEWMFVYCRMVTDREELASFRLNSCINQMIELAA
ncbi:MAG: hypothetical protein PVI21_01130 [Candidatus Woesebacteria bacterium]|jgi:hypothetical protein